MIRYGANTKLDQEKVLARAREYFGEPGLGMSVQDFGDCHLRFTGGGGWVEVAVCASDKVTEVDISAQEWERQARGFLDKI